MSFQKRIRVAFIEDAKPFAETLIELLRKKDCGIDVVGLFLTAEKALADLPKHPPEVAIVDLNLPGINGAELIFKLRRLCPSTICLVLTAYEDNDSIFGALKAGAAGYLLKRTPAERIANAIREIVGGGAPMSPQIARRVVAYFCPAPAVPIGDLSSREREVLELLANGMMYKEISDKLNIHMGTVRFHINRIYAKLHVHSRTDALLKYMDEIGRVGAEDSPG